MSGYYRRNESVIKKAFKRLNNDEVSIIRDGMTSLMDNAMLNALGIHDGTHWFHRSTGDSYGWVVLHDGESVAHKVNEGRHGDGRAYEQLIAASRLVSRTGWVGILLASMRAGDDDPTPRMFFFNLDYELSVLDEVIEDVKRNFLQYFKPIA